jgi:hypothetical protein
MAIATGNKWSSKLLRLTKHSCNVDRFDKDRDKDREVCNRHERAWFAEGSKESEKRMKNGKYEQERTENS